MNFRSHGMLDFPSFNLFYVGFDYYKTFKGKVSGVHMYNKGSFCQGFNTKTYKLIIYKLYS